MTEYLIQKNWKGIVWMVLLYLMCRYTFDTPGEVMNGFVCIFIFFWIMRVIFAGNGPKAVVMIGGLFGLVRFIWYVCSLKPLRRLIFRMFYLGAQQQPYPYLALYGSLLDTHVMMYKLSVAFYRDKTPVVRAAMWRLLARGVIQTQREKPPSSWDSGWIRPAMASTKVWRSLSTRFSSKASPRMG